MVCERLRKYWAVCKVIEATNTERRGRQPQPQRNGVHALRLFHHTYPRIDGLPIKLFSGFQRHSPKYMTTSSRHNLSGPQVALADVWDDINILLADYTDFVLAHTLN